MQDKVFLIVYQEKGTTKITQVEFRDNHFLHLTGVKSKVTAGRFYEKCINHKLSPADFEFDKGGKTQQKMMVLPFLHELLYHNCMIGNFINSGIFVRDYKQQCYTECTYLSKGQGINKLPISEETKALIQIDNDGADV